MLVLMVAGWMFCGVLYGASASKKTLVVPKVTYRQSYLTVRKDSSFWRETYKNFADHLYLSLKLVKTFDYVNEVVLEPAIRSPKNNPGGDTEVVIDQGYVDSYLGRFRLTAGKKAEFSGSGFFVNPSDLLNEDRGLFDTLYNREGKTFSRIGWNYGLYSFSIGYLPQASGTAQDGKLWLQAGGEIADIDTRLQYTYNREDLSTVGLSASRFFGDHFETHVDSRWQQQQRAHASQESRIIFHCDDLQNSGVAEERFTTEGDELECLIPQVKDEDYSMFTVLGFRFVLTPKRTIITEAIQNQGGLSPEELKMYGRFVRKRRESGGRDPDQPNRIEGKQYWFVAYQDEDSIRNTTLALSGLQNQEDGSVFLNAETRYALNPLASVSVIYSAFIGNENSEFGDHPFEGATFLTVQGRF